MIQDTNKRIQITLSKDILDILKKESAKRGVSKSAVISLALVDWIEQNGFYKVEK